MTKRILIYTAALVLVFFTIYFLNKLYIDKNEVSLAFPLIHHYLYQFFASLIIYILTEIALKKLPNETGYSYLGFTLIRFVLFLILFKDVVLSDTPLSKPEKMAIFIPWLIFSIVEGVAVVKLLNKQVINTDKTIKTNYKN